MNYIYTNIAPVREIEFEIIKSILEKKRYYKKYIRNWRRIRLACLKIERIGISSNINRFK